VALDEAALAKAADGVLTSRRIETPGVAPSDFARAIMAAMDAPA
jgi:hypothetical protein